MKKLLPNELKFVFGKTKVKVKSQDTTDGKVYIVDLKLETPLEISEFTVYDKKEKIDTVKKDIKLEKDDVLHVEYLLNAKLIG